MYEVMSSNPHSFVHSSGVGGRNTKTPAGDCGLGRQGPSAQSSQADGHRSCQTSNSHQGEQCYSRVCKAGQKGEQGADLPWESEQPLRAGG